MKEVIFDKRFQTLDFVFRESSTVQIYFKGKRCSECPISRSKYCICSRLGLKAAIVFKRIFQFWDLINNIAEAAKSFFICIAADYFLYSLSHTKFEAKVGKTV